MKDYFGSSVICSPVMPACVICHLVTRYGLSPTESNENQQTPLHMVISNQTSLYWIDGSSVVSQGVNRKRVTTAAAVAALLQLKANVNALDNKCHTPLVYAVEEEVSDGVYVHLLFIILIVDTSGHLHRTPAHAPRRQSHHT
jgi:ankyrin repeat protein